MKILILTSRGKSEPCTHKLANIKKEIQPVNPKGNQSWIFIGRTDAEAETPNTFATWCEELTHLKRPWCWERLKVGGEAGDRGWDGWMASPTHGHEFEYAPGVGDVQGSLTSCSPWGCKELDMTEQLNWKILWKKVKVLVTESCLTLQPMDYNLPASSVHGILQAWILEWVAIAFSRRLSLSLLHCRQIFYHLSGSLNMLYQGKPKNAVST